MKRFRLFLLILMLTFAVQTAWAGGAAVRTETAQAFQVLRTLEQGVEPWARIECLDDPDPHFKAEKFHPKSVQTHRAVVAAFGGGEPGPNRVLLHFAPGWDKATHKNPILLVHGAGDTAFRAWCHPFELELAPGQIPKMTGLMQYLAARGYAVFAVTFSHPHGDNFFQAEQLANAIARIKTVTKGGADFKVDLLSHSKGAMASRIYLSDLGADDAAHRWMTPFRKDVDRAMFVASPLKGLDTPFRYYLYNLTILMQDLAAPLGPTTIVYLGLPQDARKHNECFPGQAQMLHNFVDDGIPFTLESATAGDINYTRDVLYRGGTSLALVSPGIDAAARAAGSVIDRLNAKGIDPSVTAGILAGTKQAIQEVDLGWFTLPVGEFAAPSDGVAFVASTTYAAGLTRRGARVATVQTLPYHHVGVTVWPDALAIIEGFVRRSGNPQGVPLAPAMPESTPICD